MSWMVAILALVGFQQGAEPQEPAEPQGPPAPISSGVPTSSDGWSFLNGIDIVVNDRVLTHLEVIASLQEVTTEEELREQLGQIRLERIHKFLEDQAGRDMGIDPDQVDVFLRRSEELRIERLGGIRAASEQFRSRETDLTYLREFIEEDFYATTWRRWQNGIDIGPRGRVSRDRFVRPGVLKMLYRAAPDRYRKPPEVQLRQLILLFGEDASFERIEETEHLIVDLRDRILAGEDMRALVEAYSITKPGTGGMTGLLDEEQLAEFYPEVGAFLAEHPDFTEPVEGEVGPLSDVLPYVDAQGTHVGFMLVRLEKRVPALGFQSADVQARIRGDRLGDLEDVRMDLGHNRLIRQAYVWHPEVEDPNGAAASAERPKLPIGPAEPTESAAPPANGG